MRELESPALRDISQVGAAGFTGQPWTSATVAAFRRFEVETAIMEQEILRMVEEDPEGAAKSLLGMIHLKRYGFLRPDPNKDCGQNCFELVGEDYPRKFDLLDVMVDGREITLQLIAEEYLGDADNDAAPDPAGGEFTPYTLDAVLDSEERCGSYFIDPFTTDWRPPVTLEQIAPDGSVIRSLRQDARS